MEQPPPPVRIARSIFVPNLLGMDLRRAALALQRAGLRSGSVAGDTSAGVVSAQSPQPNAQVPRGSMVTLMFSVPAPPPTSDSRRAAVTRAVALVLIAGILIGAALLAGKALGAHSARAALAAVPRFSSGAKTMTARLDPQAHVVRMTMRIRTRDLETRTRTGKEPAVLRRR